MRLEKIWLIYKAACRMLIFMVTACMLTGCVKGTKTEEQTAAPAKAGVPGDGVEEGKETEEMMRFYVNDEELSVAWEENEAVEALRELVSEEPLTIVMSMYGGFEQVGAIGQDLPRNDAQTTTEAGDIVLYSGDQVVVFYGSNSWAYTRLGHITDRNVEELKELLGHEDVTITIGPGR